MKHQTPSHAGRKSRAASVRRRNGWMIGRQNVQDMWKRKGQTPLW